jgi:hypothetical protein
LPAALKRVYQLLNFSVLVISLYYCSISSSRRLKKSFLCSLFFSWILCFISLSVAKCLKLLIFMFLGLSVYYQAGFYAVFVCLLVCFGFELWGSYWLSHISSPQAGVYWLWSCV